MISRHDTVGLDEAEPGMVLCVDVLDLQGALLLPKGASLTAQVLVDLARRGVDSVQVQHQRRSGPGQAPQRARIEARLAHLFRHCEGQPLADRVRRQLTELRLQEIG